MTLLRVSEQLVMLHSLTLTNHYNRVKELNNTLFFPFTAIKTRNRLRRKPRFFHAESMITSMLRHVSRELHHGILFDRRLG